MLGFFRKNEIWQVHFGYIVTKIEYISEQEKKSLASKIDYTDKKNWFGYNLGTVLQKQYQDKNADKTKKSNALF